MSATLIALAGQVAAPLIQKILADKIGAGNAALATDVVKAIADRAGVEPAALEVLAQSDPLIVQTAIEQVEPQTPEMIELYALGLEKQFALLELDAAQPTWFSAWRPMWMYFLMLLWFWNIVGLHLVNAIKKWALPPMDMTVLLSLTGLFMALYMDGHTIKDFAKTWKGGGR